MPRGNHQSARTAKKKKKIANHATSSQSCSADAASAPGDTARISERKKLQPGPLSGVVFDFWHSVKLHAQLQDTTTRVGAGQFGCSRRSKSHFSSFSHPVFSLSLLRGVLRVGCSRISVRMIGLVRRASKGGYEGADFVNQVIHF